MIKRFHHIAIAVKDLDKALQFFEEIYGVRELWRSKMHDQKFESALIGDGNIRYELLAGLNSHSLVSRFIENKGQGIHHISIEVDRFDEVMENLKAKGLKLIAEADTADFKAAFIHPTSCCGVLTEIIEPKGMWGRYHESNREKLSGGQHG